MKRRVVVTGMGTLNALGNNVQETWEKLVAGQSGIGNITRFDASTYPARIAGEVKGFDPLNYLDAKEARKIDLFAQYALAAAHEAMADSGLDKFAYNPYRSGVISGVGIGGMITFEEEAAKLINKGAKWISPFFIPKMISNIAPAHISIRYNLKAACFNVVSACSSSNHAIGTAFRTITHGDADIMLAGGAEAAVTPLAVAGFCSLKALSTRNDDPAKACSPFDSKRDGFIMSEGAGILVLEELEHALKRGAHIYGELVGFGATADAFHITAPRDDGEGGAMALQAALADAGLKPEEVQYVNAHGTSTPLNDRTETVFIKNVFGEHANRLKISSTKSMVGHSLGAAGAIEAVACLKTIQTSTIHPTINLEDPDPDCNLDYVPNRAVSMTVDCAVSNSLGFGGQNSALVFKKYQG